MTEVYFMRHAKPLKVDNTYNSDSLQIQNEKSCLSMEGEELIKDKLKTLPCGNIDILYASNYVRAIETAKYIANKYLLDINIMSDFGERKQGIKSWDELPKDFEIRQMEDDDYKINDGESQKEVQKRMYNALLKVLEHNKGKRIFIVSHSTAMMFLFKKWCHMQYQDKCYFKNEVFFDGKWDYCETFKLIFNDVNELVDIENI